MDNLWKDMSYGVRMLLKKPGFSVVAVITLALGIGANAAIFSFISKFLLRPLPVEAPSELVSLNNVTEKGDRESPTFSWLDYLDIRDRNNVMAGLIAYRMIPTSLSHDGINERVWGYLATGNYFEVLGVKAARGRLFTPEDDRARGAHPVALITYNCWQRRFTGDPNIVGKSVIVNGHSFSVIGVTPEGFNGTEIGYQPDIWFPMMMARQIEPNNDWMDVRDAENIFVMGRLKPSVNQAQAESSLKAIAADLAREHPNENEGQQIALSPPGLFGSWMRGSVLKFGGVLMSVVGIVLLLACINLANLLLARATERRKEIAVRLALGATRIRLLRQLLTESVLLAVGGGAFGLMFAYWLVGAVMTFKLPVDIPLSTELQIDYRVLLFTFAASLLTGVLFGLLPAWQSVKPDLVPALKDDVSLAGYRRSLLRNCLVVFQITLSLVLLICSGLVVRGLRQAQFLNPGFVPQHALTVSYDLGLQGYDSDRSEQFNRQLLARVRSLPGVEYAGLSDFVPLSLGLHYDSVYVEGQPQQRGSNVPVSMTRLATPGVLQALGVRLLAGRDFKEQDYSDKKRFAIINDTFARQFWPRESAVGKRFSLEGFGGPWIEIIGVMQNGKYFSLSEAPALFAYFNMPRGNSNFVNLVVRTTSEPQNILPDIRREIQQLDANLPIYNVKTLLTHMNLPLLPARVAAALLGSFGLLALLLAAIGVFGVMAYIVGQRRREIGIRMALGASIGKVFILIIGQGLRLTVFGVVIGLALAAAGTRLLTSLLYGVSALDLVTFGAVTLLLTFVAFLACLIPARRAAKVDPIDALRCQ